jgi:hypothetical protein
VRINKKFLLPILQITAVILGIVFYSCGDEEGKKQVAPAVDLNNRSVLKEEVNKILGENTQVTFTGLFDNNQTFDVIAGTEVVTENIWGIKFSFLEKDKNKLTKGFQTKLLEGSFRDCLVNKIKFPSFDYELIYYNSRDYYMGSGGGEVFSYVIDFNKKETFYAHLVAEPEKPVYLYLSDNISNPEIKNFFIGNFKRDYPSPTLIATDIDLED